MVDGVGSVPGHSALLLAAEEPGQGPDPAPALHLLTVEPTVRDKAGRLKIAIFRTVQVKLILTFNPSKVR